MSAVVPFDFHGFEVRALTVEDEPWFVLKDVMGVLGMKNVTDTRKRLDQHDFDSIEVTDTIGRKQNTTIINESGLYDVILDSRKPQAKAFRRWVTSDVLPNIRQKGGYLTPEATEAALTDPDFIIRLATSLKEERQARIEAEAAEAVAIERREKAEAANAVMQPKAKNYDTFIRSKGAFDFNRVAKNLGIGRNKMLAELRRVGVLIPKGEAKNVPYQRYAKHFEITPYTYVNAYGKESAQYKVRVKPSGVALIADKCASLVFANA